MNTVHAADEHLRRAEETVLQNALEAFEKGDLEGSKLTLSRFRALVGTRTIPAEASSATLELAYRLSLADAKSIIQTSPPADGLANTDFSNAWNVVQQRTAEWIALTETVISGCLERRNESGAVNAVTRIQRARLERANVLLAAHAFNEALMEFDAASALFKKYSQLADKTITVHTHSPQGMKTQQHRRGDAAGLLGLQSLAERRLQALRAWRLAAPASEEAANQLASASRDFVDAYPSHAQSYYCLRESMEIRDILDVDRLRKTLDATGDKRTQQYVSNQISLANLLLSAKRYDEAMPLYEAAAESEFCPKSRLAEAYVQMADIHVAKGQKDLARKCYTIAESLSDRFKHIGPALKALDAPVPPPLSSSVGIKNRSNRFWVLLAVNAGVTVFAICAFAAIRLRQHPGRTGPRQELKP